MSSGGTLSSNEATGNAEQGPENPQAVQPQQDTIDDILLLSALREEGKAELLYILESIEGKKCLVIDVQLGGLLNQIIVEGSQILKENEVEYFRELKGELGGFPAGVPDHVIYLVRPELGLMGAVANQMLMASNSSIHTSFHVYFVPQKSVACVQLLKDHLGLSGGRGTGDAIDGNNVGNALWQSITFGEFELGLIPFDTDILSLEMGNAFKQCHVDGDYSSLNAVAMALQKVQVLFGIIPHVRSKGTLAQRVLQKLMSLRVTEENRADSSADSAATTRSTGSTGSTGDGDGNGDGVDLAADATSKTTLPTATGAGTGIASSSSIHAMDEGRTNTSNNNKPAASGVKYNPRSEIDVLVILDREIDLISPLVTPLTYEGLIDDTVGIENGRVKLDAEVLGSSDQQDALSAKMAAAATASATTGAGSVKAAEAAGAAAAAAAASGTAATSARAAGDKVSFPLNNNDAIYAEIRDLSIERLGAYLQEKAILIRERYTTFRDNKSASITEIHDFVKKIPQLTREYKSLNQHINIAEMLKTRTDSPLFLEQWQEERGMLEGDSHLDEIEDLICADAAGDSSIGARGSSNEDNSSSGHRNRSSDDGRKASSDTAGGGGGSSARAGRSQLIHILRLMCIQSLTSGGIRASRFDSIRRMIAQTYGYEQVYTMHNLEKAGLLKRKDTLLVVEITSQWAMSRKALRLIEERSDQETISYVTAGYAPILVRLVQLLGLSSGTGGSGGSGAGRSTSWNNVPNAAQVLEVLKLMPGPLLEFAQLPTVAESLTEALQRSAREASTLSGGVFYTSSGLVNRSGVGITSSSNALDARDAGDNNSTPASSLNSSTAAAAAAASALSTTNALFNYTTSSFGLMGTGSGSVGTGAAGSNTSNTSDNGVHNIDNMHDMSITGAAVTSPGAGVAAVEKRVMMVFIVGGLSFTEIAAFRLLSKDPSFPYRIVLATTKLVSGASFVTSLQHHFVPSLQ